MGDHFPERMPSDSKTLYPNTSIVRSARFYSVTTYNQAEGYHLACTTPRKRGRMGNLRAAETKSFRRERQNPLFHLSKTVVCETPRRDGMSLSYHPSLLTARLHFAIYVLYEHLCRIQQRFPEAVQNRGRACQTDQATGSAHQ
jgi:hypothetical protein